jgi:hypothetical protein
MHINFFFNVFLLKEKIIMVGVIVLFAHLLFKHVNVF